MCWGFVGSGEGASEGSPFWPSHIMYVQLFILAMRLSFHARGLLLGR